MDKVKQIEEMQNTLIKIAKQPIMIEGLAHWSDVITEELYNAGYRKASEVAREIFEEVDEAMIEHARGNTTDHWLFVRIAELKKKYTESEKDNDNS